MHLRLKTNDTTHIQHALNGARIRQSACYQKRTEFIYGKQQPL